MRPLTRLLATSMLEALRTRQHVRIAVGSAEALLLELERAVASTLPRVVPYLMAGAHGDEAVSFEHHKHEAISELVDAVTEALARSSHVDDIYSGDVAVRRDLTRAAQRLLNRYMAGELEIEEDVAADGNVSIALDGLGYLASVAIRAGTDALVRKALVRAGERVGAVLYHFDATKRRASFRPKSGNAPMLALEDAVALSLRHLIDDGKVGLPSLEEQVELRAGIKSPSTLRRELSELCDSFARRNRCVVRCEPHGARSFRLSLTPLSPEVAERAPAFMSALLGDVTRRMGSSASTEPSQLPGTSRRGTSARASAARGGASSPAKQADDAGDERVSVLRAKGTRERARPRRARRS